MSVKYRKYNRNLVEEAGRDSVHGMEGMSLSLSNANVTWEQAVPMSEGQQTCILHWKWSTWFSKYFR